VIGGGFVLILYLWLFYRAGLIIRRSRSTYGAFLAFGLSFGLVLQAFVNMAVAVGLVPVTGQTLPLVSMGGSSIIFTSMAAGMILSVSWGCDESRIKSEESEESSPEDDQNSQTSEAAVKQVMKEGTEASGTGKKKQKRTRTEFEINA